MFETPPKTVTWIYSTLTFLACILGIFIFSDIHCLFTMFSQFIFKKIFSIFICTHSFELNNKINPTISIHQKFHFILADNRLCIFISVVCVCVDFFLWNEQYILILMSMLLWRIIFCVLGRCVIHVRGNICSKYILTNRSYQFYWVDHMKCDDTHTQMHTHTHAYKQTNKWPNIDRLHGKNTIYFVGPHTTR